MKPQLRGQWAGNNVSQAGKSKSGLSSLATGWGHGGFAWSRLTRHATWMAAQNAEGRGSRTAATAAALGTIKATPPQRQKPTSRCASELPA